MRSTLNLHALRGGILVFALCAGILTATSTCAASAPDWIAPFLTGPAATWQTKQPATILLQRLETRFVTPDVCSMISRGIMRANTLEGVEHLNLRFPYNQDNTRIISVKAWIISPNGKTVALSRRDFTDVSTVTDSRLWHPSRALTYAVAQKAEPGSIVGWEFSFETPVLLSEAGWSAPAGVGFFRGEFEVIPSANARIIWHTRNESIPPPVSGTAPGSLVWRIDDFKPVRGARPDGFSPTPFEIRVRCASTQTGNEAPAESWAAMSRWWAEVFAAKAVVTDQLQAVATAELRDKHSRWERVQALAQLVQRKITYLATTDERDIFAGCRPHAATEVLTHEIGDCKDKTTLMIALLRAAGEEAYPALVAAGRPAAVDPAWPAQEFNHVIVAMKADADVAPWWPVVTGPNGIRYVLFDPTARTLPFGCLPPQDQGGRLLILAQENGGLVEVTGNFPGVAPARWKTTIVLDANGSAKVSEVQETFGTTAGLVHDTVDREGRERFTHVLEEALKSRAPGARRLQWNADWDSAAGRSVLKLDYEIANATRRVGKDQLLLTLPLANQHGALSPWETSSPGSAWLPRVDFEQEVQLTLPRGATIAELPPAFEARAGEAEAKIAYSAASDGLICSQRLLRAAGSYSKSDYHKLQQLVDKMGVARRHPVLLQFAPTPIASTP